MEEWRRTATFQHRHLDQQKLKSNETNSGDAGHKTRETLNVEELDRRVAESGKLTERY